MKKLIQILICFIFVSSIFCLSGCIKISDYDKAKGYLKETLNIDVPSNSKILYYYQEDNFQGVHETYIVFEFTENVDNWLNNYEFYHSQDDSEKSIEDKEKFEKDLKQWLDGSSKMPAINKELLPNLEKEYYWLLAMHTRKPHDHYFDFFLYYPDTNIFMCYRPFL